MDIKLKLFINVAANFALFMIYAYLFGQQSIQKYFERGITIIKYTESPSVVMPPGIQNSIYYYILIYGTMTIKYFWSLNSSSFDFMENSNEQ